MEENKSMSQKLQEHNDKKAQEFNEQPTKRKGSPSQTIKSFSNNVNNLIELKLVNTKDAETLKAIQKKAVEQYLGFELGL